VLKSIYLTEISISKDRENTKKKLNNNPENKAMFNRGVNFSATQSLSAWGIIAMLIIFFTVHIFMLTSDKFHKFHKIALWGRIVLPFAFIYWAYLYV
jgi:lipoprotein signal peptidase